MNLKRTLAGSAALVVALSVGACGGGDGGGSDAPEAANEADFCEAYNGVEEKLGEIDPEAPEEEQIEQAVDGFKAWASDMEEVGTPEGIPEDARAGFDTIIEAIGDFEAGDFESQEDFEKLDEDFTEEEQDSFDALEKYATETCDGSGGDDSGSTEE